MKIKHKHLTVPEAADYIRVSKSTLDQMRVHGGGPRFIKLSRKVLYDIEDIDQWIKECKQKSTADTPTGKHRRSLRVIK